MQIIHYSEGLFSNYYKQQFQILMELEMEKCDFVEFIEWPILILPKANNEYFHKISIPTAF